MISDKSLLGIIETSLWSALDISHEFTNATKSACFVSKIGEQLESIYAELFDTNYQRVDEMGKRSSGEWMLDISVTRKHSVKETFGGKTTEKFINKQLIWAVESESSTSTEDFCIDFGKLLCVKSMNYLYINGLNQSTENKTSEYIKKRLHSVVSLLQDVLIEESLYYAFFPTPATGANCDSIWSELKKGQYTHLGVKLYKYNGLVFDEVLI